MGEADCIVLSDSSPSQASGRRRASTHSWDTDAGVSAAVLVGAAHLQVLDWAVQLVCKGSCLHKELASHSHCLGVTFE